MSKKPSALVYAENMSAAMTKLGISDAAIGKKLGVSRVTVWRWRTGKMEPLGCYRDQVAEVLKTTVQRLYRG